MQLRSDPAASAMMAGAFTRNNATHLENAIGRQPSEGELYIAHFLGSEGASKLIGVAATQPQANAANMFPRAAAANPSIFYDRAGHARSAGDVYANLSGKFEVARAVQFAPGAGRTELAQGPAQPAIPPHDTAGVTAAFAAANGNLPPLPDTKPLFQAMFTDRARQAVSKTVGSLWAPSKEQASDSSARPLDLFTDSGTDTRKLFRGSTT
jgi:hypothetical protein